jgi:hypothetical protein
MGGLVARAMQLECPDIWKKMMSRPGARFLMLGTPNAGSWAPMQVLSGDDTFGNTLVAFGAPFQDHEARQMMARFPGFIQLQAALLDVALGLDKEQTWQALADDDLRRVREHNWWHKDIWHDEEPQLNPYVWGIPPQTVLDRAVALRKRLDMQRGKDLQGFKNHLLMVVGKARFTPDSYEIGSGGLVYLDAKDGGDGRVTLQNALLPGVKTWSIDCEHGKLPDHRNAFEAYLDLLERGETSRLSPLAAADSLDRGAMPAVAPVEHVRSRPSRIRSGVPPETVREIETLPSSGETVSQHGLGEKLHISVINGNLKFVHLPLMLGHYQAETLTGTERTMDELIGGTMTASLRLGRYPNRPGSEHIFVNTTVSPINPMQMPRPESVIVVGLGQEGKLAAGELKSTVRQGVIAWAQRILEQGAGAPERYEIAATLIGSGGAGISAGQAARLVASGIREANDRLAQNKWPQVWKLHFIELYLDRASEAWRALQLLSAAEPGCYSITETVQAGTGPLRRPLDSNYRGAAYDLITAETRKDQYGGGLIAYTLDTKRARTEVRAQSTQLALLRKMVAGESNLQNSDDGIGRTLFQLLVPIEMEPYLGGTSEMQMELDRGTAAIPWELLDTPAGTREGGDTRPWAIRAKLLRKLRTEDFRQQVMDADVRSHVLVIGEPKCDTKFYQRLPGARAEARAVAERLRMPGALGADMVKDLISADDDASGGVEAETVIKTLLERPWRVVHIAGHGVPPQEEGDPRGVVLSNNTFLGPREIRSMRTVPELVFINCCHLGVQNGNNLLQVQSQPYDRAKFAANVAESLINIGVRCVVAAGWAVNDAAAQDFAVTFYDALLRRERFLDAVAIAREAAWKRRGRTDNTWAAYQCYGDADWRLTMDGAGETRSRVSPAEEFAAVASPSELALALETLVVNARYEKSDRHAQRTKLQYLEGRYASQWGTIGAVAEAFGLAWAETANLENAVTWYEEALSANDGSATLRAAEQLGNLRARLAWSTVITSPQFVEEKAGNNGESLNGKKQDPVSAVLSKGRAQVREALQLLNRLVEVKPTIERENLCGSAYKRLAMIEALAHRSEAELKAIANMKAHYANAETMASAASDPELFYPALNRIAAELIVDAGEPDWPGLDPIALASIRQSLNNKISYDPDFWSVAGLIELHLYESVAQEKLAAALPSIQEEFKNLYRRVSSITSWSSVRDQGEFVLLKYMQRAPDEEQKAAITLLEQLAVWAASDPRRINQYAIEKSRATRSVEKGGANLEASEKKPVRKAPKPRERHRPRPPSP